MPKVRARASTASETEAPYTPWTDPKLTERVTKKKRNNNSRFRQHVNPLSREYQKPAPLPEAWPKNVFDEPTKKLHVDIGSGKGGFLIDLATRKSSPHNLLGLEIRPGPALYAKDRVSIHKVQGALDFLGCNANVDLDRIASLYKSSSGLEFPLDLVSIQYPDPHFKKQHAKRRVVTSTLVRTAAKFMAPGTRVFLQSDIQSVLDEMRQRFRDSGGLFKDTIEATDKYLEMNPLGVPTERELSVLNKGLPVYRSLLLRTDLEVGKAKPQPDDAKRLDADDERDDRK